MRDPAAYKGREQTWLKHRVLEEYLAAWAQKLGSVSREREVRLWYVDCFSGPWQSADEDLKDTSIAIGLEELQAAADTWAKSGNQLKLGAIFVEKDKKAFAALQTFVAQNKRAVDVFTYQGEFGDHVATIQNHIGREDSAFLFVDPTGWKGAAMKFIEPLARLPRRDLLVNVMFHHINRFKDPGLGRHPAIGRPSQVRISSTTVLIARARSRGGALRRCERGRRAHAA